MNIGRTVFTSVLAGLFAQPVALQAGDGTTEATAYTNEEVTDSAFAYATDSDPVYYLLDNYNYSSTVIALASSDTRRKILMVQNGGSITSTGTTSQFSAIGYGSTSSPTHGCGNSITLSGNGDGLTTDDTLATSWTSTAKVYVGYNGSSNTLTIRNGADMTVSGSGNELDVGYGNSNFSTSSTYGYNNSLTVTGHGSTLSTQALYVGRSGCSNSMTISAGATVTSTASFIGSGDAANAVTGSNNSVTVQGNGNGTSVDDSSGTAWVASSIKVGAKGSSNTLTIKNGADVSAVGFYAGEGASNSTASKWGHNNVVNVNGFGSTLKIGTGAMYIGYFGYSNSMSITGGASVTNGAKAYIGWFSGTATSTLGSLNTVEVTGLGSTWISSGILSIGKTYNYGNTLTITDGALVSCAGLTIEASSDTSKLNGVLLDDGYLAIKGTITESNYYGLIQVFDGTSYVTVDADHAAYLNLAYCDSVEEIQAVLGDRYTYYSANYSDLMTTLSSGYTIVTSTVPEPSTFAFLGGLGVLGFAMAAHRRRK